MNFLNYHSHVDKIKQDKRYSAFFIVIPNTSPSFKYFDFFVELYGMSYSTAVGIHQYVPRRWLFQHIGGSENDEEYNVSFF